MGGGSTPVPSPQIYIGRFLPFFCHRLEHEHGISSLPRLVLKKKFAGGTKKHRKHYRGLCPYSERRSGWGYVTRFLSIGSPPLHLLPRILVNMRLAPLTQQLLVCVTHRAASVTHDPFCFPSCSVVTCQEAWIRVLFDPSSPTISPLFSSMVTKFGECTTVLGFGNLAQCCSPAA